MKNKFIRSNPVIVYEDTKTTQIPYQDNITNILEKENNIELINNYYTNIINEINNLPSKHANNWVISIPLIFSLLSSLILFLTSGFVLEILGIITVGAIASYTLKVARTRLFNKEKFTLNIKKDFLEDALYNETVQYLDIEKAVKTIPDNQEVSLIEPLEAKKAYLTKMLDYIIEISNSLNSYEQSYLNGTLQNDIKDPLKYELARQLIKNYSKNTKK